MTDEESPSDHRRVLVPVDRSTTLRSTVAHVIETVLEETPDDEHAEVHFVYVLLYETEGFGQPEEAARGEALLDRIRSWVEIDQEDTDSERLTIETTTIGRDQLIFAPSEFADILTGYAADHGLGRIVLDPGYNPGGAGQLLQPLEFELAQSDLYVEEAPVARPARRTRLRQRITSARFIAVFGMSGLLYALLGDPTYTFDLVTGMLTALVTATVLSSITFSRDPQISRTGRRLARGLIYPPYLLYEIVKANIAVAAVILHPSLPIEPRMTRVRCQVPRGLPVTTLANSITLTPGTLTVRARNQDLYVHTLLPASREDLFDGGLEQWVRFIFGGRSATRSPSPRERGDTSVLQGSGSDEPLFSGRSGATTTERAENSEEDRGEIA